MRLAHVVVLLLTLLLLPLPLSAQEIPEPDPDLVEIDRQARQVRVVGEALRPDMPLEFICVVTGTADHEALLRTRVTPSVIHAGLLALGLEPGRPLRFSEAAQKWLAPSGPPVRISVEWTDADGRMHREPVERLIRGIDDGKPMPPQRFVFVGSQIFEGTGGPSTYAADATGQVVSLVNFEYPMIDVAHLASSANETLEWEVNPEMAPPMGTALTMILEPLAAAEAETPATRPATQPAPAHVVLVEIDAEGGVEVNHRPVEVEVVAHAVKVAAVSGRDQPATVRLSAVRGTPVEVVGRVIGQLVRGGITDVTFVAPEEVLPATRAGVNAFVEPIHVIVGEGGRTVTLSDNPPRFGVARPAGFPLGDFVGQLQEIAEGQEDAFMGGGGEFGNLHLLLNNPSRPVVVMADPTAGDIEPVDLAAPAAALYVLGYDLQRVEPVKAAATDENRQSLQELRRSWEQQVLPQADALRMAAQTHYEVMQAYQDRINALLDEADALRREMDDLQRRFDELTTPQPTIGE